MRRVLVVMLALSAAGMFAAQASRSTTNAEDITSFTTNVSISVPDTTPCPVVTFPLPAFVRTVGGAPVLDLVYLNDPLAPGTDNPLPSRELLPDATPGGAVQLQQDNRFFQTWEAPGAPTCGFRLAGSIRLDIRQSPSTQRVRDGLRVGLFDCPSSALADSISSEGCSLVATGTLTAAGGSDRTVSFGPPGGSPAPIDVTITAGRELRLKIVNQSFFLVGTAVTSSPPWDIIWGYGNNYQAKLYSA